MKYVVGFFIKNLTQQKKLKRFDCSFSKFWGAEISAEPHNYRSCWDRWKKQKKKKNGYCQNKKLKYKTIKPFIKNRSCHVFFTILIKLKKKTFFIVLDQKWPLKKWFTEIREKGVKTPKKWIVSKKRGNIL